MFSMFGNTVQGTASVAGSFEDLEQRLNREMVL